MNDTVNILIVDDEINILSALLRLFFDCDFNVTTSASPQDALRLFEMEGPFDIVLSDFMMPGLNGVDFLAMVSAMCPDTICIILSGHADMPAITKAINEGYIKRFMAKPWDNNALLTMIGDEVQNVRKRYVQPHLSAGSGVVK